MTKLVLIFLCLSVSATPSKFRFIPNENLPPELKIALEAYQLDLSHEDFKALEARLLRLSSLFSQLSEKERNFVIRSEFYKTLLDLTKIQDLPKSYFQVSTLKDLEKKIKTLNDETSFFKRWMLNLVHRDLTLLLNSQNADLYLQNINNKELLETKELKPLHKRFKIILSLYQHLDKLSKEEWDDLIRKFFNMALIKIERSSEFLTSMSITRSAEDFNFFIKKETPLEDLIDETKINKFLSTLKPDPKYKAPEFLPDPIDDWLPKEEPIYNDRQIFPDPAYSKPEVLPTPVGDWN